MAKYSPFKARLVMGSPFELKTTDHTGKPEANPEKHHWFMAFAVPKGPQWDAVYNTMYQEAASDARCGQALCNQLGFNWKIEDCDAPEDATKLGTSSRPAGHMLIKFTRYVGKVGMPPVPVYDGNHQRIVNQKSIKRGDYFYVAGSTVFNGAGTVKTNAGMYQNIDALMFAEVGEEIVSEGGFNVANEFAGLSGGHVVNGGVSQDGAPAAFTPPPVAGVPTPVTPPPAAPGVPVPPPATDLLVTPPPVEEKYNVNGAVYTKSQLLGFPGFTEEVIAGLTRA